ERVAPVDRDRIEPVRVRDHCLLCLRAPNRGRLGYALRTGDGLHLRAFELEIQEAAGQSEEEEQGGEQNHVSIGYRGVLHHASLCSRANCTLRPERIRLPRRSPLPAVARVGCGGNPPSCAAESRVERKRSGHEWVRLAPPLRAVPHTEQIDPHGGRGGGYPGTIARRDQLPQMADRAIAAPDLETDSHQETHHPVEKAIRPHLEEHPSRPNPPARLEQMASE